MTHYFKRLKVLVTGGLTITLTIICSVALTEQNAVASTPEIRNSSDNPNQMRVDRKSVKLSDYRHRPHYRCRPYHRYCFRPSKYPNEFRSITGYGNNIAYSNWGQANQTLNRVHKADYTDGSGSMAGSRRPNPRTISNEISTQALAVVSDKRKVPTNMLWQWGQFLDHDLGLSPESHPEELSHISVPTGDQWFDPGVTGSSFIPFNRSTYQVVNGVRQQINVNSTFIDASNVYGSDDERANDLRTNDGTGRLRTSSNNLLPFNTSRLPNAPSDSPNFFIAGDFRANEQVGLTAMHTVFVREHNSLADYILRVRPWLSGDEVYQRARALVAAEIQFITYREFLPVLLGRNALSRYRGYQAKVNPTLNNEFTTAAFRFGHSMLPELLPRKDRFGRTIAQGDLALKDAFFNPEELRSNGLESLLRGLTLSRAEVVDPMVVDTIRNLLFGEPGNGGLDLVSLNIQRGRDHGLPSYKEVRKKLGLGTVTRFSDITSDQELQRKLKRVYKEVGKVDLWVGGLAEEAYNGGLVGKTFHMILKDQFERLRDGDRFWYSKYLPRQRVRWVRRQSLAKIIRRNTKIGYEIPRNVFVLRGNRP